MTEQEQPIAFVRDTAKVSEQSLLGEATTQIQYVSQGHCLVIADPIQALDVAAPLLATGITIVHIDPAVSRPEKQLTDTGIKVFIVPALELAGYLGAYRATVPAGEGESDVEFDLGVAALREAGSFDLVLDLSESPLLPMRLAPFGYHHATAAEQISTAVSELVGLVGEFEKPRYFSYNSAICAHSRSELSGCQQCLDVCVTGAISSDGEGVSIDPFLCQGCGSCATVCPSGAMSYAFPKPVDAIERTRQALLSHAASIIVLHTEGAQTAMDAAQPSVGVLPLQVEEVSAFGADFWLAMLTGAARRIFVVLDSPADDPNRLALESQIHWLEPMFGALGVESFPIRLVHSDALAETLLQASEPANAPSTRQLSWENRRATDFATHGDKRQTMRLALDALSEQLQPDAPIVELPVQAPFGRISVDSTACTLCMACVSTCPAKALLDGQDTPALRFIENNCLQCGLCETACPESAITLKPQYTWDSIEARKIETLHEEVPFRCERCQTAFTTQTMVDTMTRKLTEHWMFQNEKALRRLRLCGDCRVRDLFEEDAKGIAVHRHDT